MTIALKDVPFIEALDFILRPKGLSYRVFRSHIVSLNTGEA